MLYARARGRRNFDIVAARHLLGWTTDLRELSSSETGRRPVSQTGAPRASWIPASTSYRFGRTAAAPRREPDRCTGPALHKSMQLAARGRVLTAALRAGATAASDRALLAQTRSRSCQQAPTVTP